MMRTPEKKNNSDDLFPKFSDISYYFEAERVDMKKNVEYNTRK